MPERDYLLVTTSTVML